MKNNIKKSNLNEIKDIARIAAKEELNGVKHYYLLGHGITIDTKRGLVLEVKVDNKTKATLTLFDKDKWVEEK